MAVSNAVEMIVKLLVKNPDDVVIESSSTEPEEGEDLGHLDISLQVHPDDRGRVIGRRGKTINALRTLAKAAATKAQQRVSIEVMDN